MTGAQLARQRPSLRRSLTSLESPAYRAWFLSQVFTASGTAFAPAAWLAIAGLVVTGCLSIWFIAAANTLVQLATEPGMRGWVMGLWTTALPGSAVASGPLAGWVTQDVGPREGFALSGMALAAIAVTGWPVLTRKGAT